MSEFDKASDTFVLWLRDNDATVSDSIAIKDFRSQNAGRGVVAVKDIKEGDLLFSLPRKILLSEETSELANIPDVKEKLQQLDGWAPLILCMMYESQRKQSFWKPYFDILPKEFSTPMFWEQKDLDELAGTSVIDKIGKDDAETLYKETLLPIIQSHPDVFDENVHNVQLFHVCGSLIMAYSFHDELAVRTGQVGEKKEDDDVDSDDEEEDQGIIAMVPMADMLNHRTGFNNARLFHEPEALQMRAIKDIKAQDQVYNTYGDLCNGDLLRKYGFVDDPNEHDIVEISGDLVRDECCPIDSSEEEKEAKVTFLLEEEALDDCFVIESNGDIPPELLVCVQVFMMSSQDFSTMLGKRKLPKAKRSAVVMDTIKAILNKRLDQYPGHLEDDENRLRDSSLKLNQHNSLIVKIGEQRILQKALLQAHSADDQDRKRKKLRK
ncbi:Ribosomal lysine N-methyltransferase 4 [Umbelopsis sp. WA50703]